MYIIKRRQQERLDSLTCSEEKAKLAARYKQFNSAPISSVPTDAARERIEQLANKKDLKGILRLGDQVILKKYLKLSEDEIIVIKKSIEALKYWRNPT